MIMLVVQSVVLVFAAGLLGFALGWFARRWFRPPALS